MGVGVGGGGVCEGNGEKGKALTVLSSDGSFQQDRKSRTGFGKNKQLPVSENVLQFPKGLPSAGSDCLKGWFPGAPAL